MGKRSSTKDPNAPKRPLGSFFLFAGDMRPVIKKANPSATIGDIGKELGKRWKNIDAPTKKKYEAMAAAGKKDYEKAMEKYRAEKDDDEDEAPSKSKRGRK